MLCAADGLALLNDRAALLDDRSLALPSTHHVARTTDINLFVRTD